MRKTVVTIISMLMVATAVSAQDITLPQPKKTGGMPLMEALNKRQSIRSYTDERIDTQTLSNLLWAAWGYNRDDKRTAPSGMNKQEIDLYVVLRSGAYLYDAKANQLVLINKKDIRKNVGADQEFSQNAPLNIVFVADKTKGDGAMTAAYISQNIYLFCASEGLGTVARGSFKPEAIQKDLKLSEKQKIVLVQPVGKPNDN